jgi:hypothetical protein
MMRNATLTSVLTRRATAWALKQRVTASPSRVSGPQTVRLNDPLPNAPRVHTNHPLAKRADDHRRQY